MTQEEHGFVERQESKRGELASCFTIRRYEFSLLAYYRTAPFHRHTFRAASLFTAGPRELSDLRISLIVSDLPAAELVLDDRRDAQVGAEPLQRAEILSMFSICSFFDLFVPNSSCCLSLPLSLSLSHFARFPVKSTRHYCRGPSGVSYAG